MKYWHFPDLSDVNPYSPFWWKELFLCELSTPTALSFSFLLLRILSFLLRASASLGISLQNLLSSKSSYMRTPMSWDSLRFLSHRRGWIYLFSFLRNIKEDVQCGADSLTPFFIWIMGSTGELEKTFGFHIFQRCSEILFSQGCACHSENLHFSGIGSQVLVELRKQAWRASAQGLWVQNTLLFFYIFSNVFSWTAVYWVFCSCPLT